MPQLSPIEAYAKARNRECEIALEIAQLYFEKWDKHYKNNEPGFFRHIQNSSVLSFCYNILVNRKLLAPVEAYDFKFIQLLYKDIQIGCPEFDDATRLRVLKLIYMIGWSSNQ